MDPLERLRASTASWRGQAVAVGCPLKNFARGTKNNPLEDDGVFENNEPRPRLAFLY